MVGRGYAPYPGSGPGQALRQSAGELHGEAVQAAVLPDQGAAGDGDDFAAGEGLPDDVCSRGVGIVTVGGHQHRAVDDQERSEEHTSELQSLMRISYAVFCLKKKTTKNKNNTDK